MNTEKIFALEDIHMSGAYAKRPVALVRGKGARVWDSEGREYIDCIGGHGVAVVGHSHPEVVRAISEQAERMVICPESFYNDRRAELYELLSRHTPDGLSRFFLCNSGAEAVEGAIKVARYFTGRPGIVAMKSGFHGRTLGALSATWNPKYRKPFEPLLPGFRHVPFGDLEAADRAVGDDTAAVIVEPVQGEGGVNPGSAEFFDGLRRLCDERGALLIADEVQTGFGRTGRWFASEHFGLAPDIMALGKGIAGGVPAGAVVWHERLGTLKPGTHGSTFGGNPLAAAAAVATIRVLEEGRLPERAERLGTWLMAELRQIRSPVVKEVRGLGLMVGVALRIRVTPVLRALMEKGVLALPAGPTVLRLLPPLVIEEDDLATVVGAIREVLEGV